MQHFKKVLCVLIGCFLATNGYSAIAGYYSAKSTPKASNPCPPNQPNCNTKALLK